MAEQQRLLGVEEEVGLGRGGWTDATVGDEVGCAAYGVGDASNEIGAFALARFPAEEGGDGHGVDGLRVAKCALHGGRTEAVPACGRPVAHRDEQRGAAGVQRDA